MSQNLPLLRGRMGRSVDPVTRIVVEADVDAAAGQTIQVAEIVEVHPMLAELTDGSIVTVNASAIGLQPVGVDDVVLIVQFACWWILVDWVEVF